MQTLQLALCKLVDFPNESEAHWESSFYRPYGQQGKNAARAKLPSLNLQECGKLRSLRLVSIRFGALQVPSGCTVYVDLFTEEPFKIPPLANGFTVYSLRPQKDVYGCRMEWAPFQPCS